VKQLLEEKSVQTFDNAKLQKAIVRSQGTRRSMYQATLVTTNGEFWMTPMDTEQFSEKHRIVDKVNAFLGNPQSPILKIESGYSSLFWIGAGIFIAGFALLSFGIVISWQLISKIPVNK
jgi:hypothetical protein